MSNDYLAKRASDQVAAEGLGAFFDSCPPDSVTMHSPDDEPMTLVVEFSDGSVLRLEVCVMTCRSAFSPHGFSAEGGTS